MNGSGVREVPLSRGMVALVDECDWHLVSQYKWCSDARIGRGKTSYACSCVNGRKLYMHRFLMRPEDHQCVDHINGNGLDNRRCNLRTCTMSQNQANRHYGIGSSSFKGVSWFGESRKWRADVYKDGKTFYLGLYTSEEDAARAYDAKALELFGAFARLNFPLSEEVSA